MRKGRPPVRPGIDPTIDPGDASQSSLSWDDLLARSSHLHSNRTRYLFFPFPATARIPQHRRRLRPRQEVPGKPPYRPPSSLDRGDRPPARSDLPFDFCFSYTKSSPGSKPIGLREPRYSPFGPGRLDRPWTGLCAPATLRDVDTDDPLPDAEKGLEEARRRERESACLASRSPPPSAPSGSRSARRTAPSDRSTLVGFGGFAYWIYQSGFTFQAEVMHTADSFGCIWCRERWAYSQHAKWHSQ
jgi:hypothetical protein